MTDASGRTSYTYDSRDRLLTKASPFGTLTYTYDAAGNTLSLKSSNAGGASMTYAYDPLNRLSSVTDASGTTAMNRLPAKTAEAFFSTGTCAGGVCEATKVSFTYSATGRRLSMADTSGATNYTYDNRDRLLTKAWPFGSLASSANHARA